MRQRRYSSIYSCNNSPARLVVLWILTHLLPFSFLIMNDLKANSIFLKSIHDGIDLEFPKRREICPLTLLGPWFLSDRPNLLHKHHISERFVLGTHYESSKFDLSYFTLTGQMNHMAAFPVLNGGICKHIWCRYFLVETEMSVSVNTSVCDSEICSPLRFWPVKLDNSKVLRKQRQRDMNVAKVTLLQT